MLENVVVGGSGAGVCLEEEQCIGIQPFMAWAITGQACPAVPLTGSSLLGKGAWGTGLAAQSISPLVLPPSPTPRGLLSHPQTSPLHPLPPTYSRTLPEAQRSHCPHVSD